MFFPSRIIIWACELQWILSEHIQEWPLVLVFRSFWSLFHCTRLVVGDPCTHLRLPFQFESPLLSLQSSPLCRHILIRYGGRLPSIPNRLKNSERASEWLLWSSSMTSRWSVLVGLEGRPAPNTPLNRTEQSCLYHRLCCTTMRSQVECYLVVLHLILIWVMEETEQCLLHYRAASFALALTAFQCHLTILSQVVWRAALKTLLVFFQDVFSF